MLEIGRRNLQHHPLVVHRCTRLEDLGRYIFGRDELKSRSALSAWILLYQVVGPGQAAVENEATVRLFVLCSAGTSRLDTIVRSFAVL